MSSLGGLMLICKGVSTVKAIKIISFVLFLVLLLSTACTLSLSANDTETGIAFTAEDKYRTQEPLSVLPATFEATLMLPTNTEGRGGVILGCFFSSKVSCVNFEVHENGVPRLYIIDEDLTVYDVRFKTVNVCTGEFLHLAIVKDSAAGTVACYVNGELAETQEFATPANVALAKPIALGGDVRKDNGQFFKGTLKSLTLYEDVRSAEEIAADSQGTLDTNGLIGHYELSNGKDAFTDAGGKGPDFLYSGAFLQNYQGVTDYAYSFALVGDTQILTKYHGNKLTAMYDWIVGNVQEKKIKFVFGLGDITDTNTNGEWKRAEREILKMEGVVPYSIIRGNHDRPENMFNKYFSYEKFGKNVLGSYDGTMLNTYQELIVGSIKYLVVNLDYGPSDDVLAWANEVVEKYPEHNVIVTTHIYLTLDGTTLDAEDSGNALTCGGFNTGDQMWDKFISKHENIVLVLCGHKPTDYITVARTKGVHGNEVVQIMVDPQGTDKNMDGVGLVAMMYFSKDGRSVDVEYYSTDRQAYFHRENQFHLELNVIGNGTAEEPTTEEVQTTDPATTDAPATEPPATQPETEPTAPEKGCNASVCLAVPTLTLALALLFTKKKKR